jgi:hypothetical protein
MTDAAETLLFYSMATGADFVCTAYLGELGHHVMEG